MNKYLLIIILTLSNLAHAALPDIVALVDDAPITLYEFQARKKLFIVLNNIQNIDENTDKQLSLAALNSLIDEQILFHHSKKVGGKTSEGEIAEAISTIEKRNKMPKGYLPLYLKSNGVDIESFRSQIKAEIVKMNILGYISRSISISPREVDAAILAVGNKDPHIIAEIYSSKDKQDKTLNNMHFLQKKITSCSSIKQSAYASFADMITVNDHLNRLDHSVQNTIKSLSSDQVSNVYEDNDSFKIVVVCEKKFNNLSTEENNYVTNLLNNKKMSQKAMKFFQDLRKKAYIKIMIP